MTQLRDLKISTLDLVPVRADAGPAQSLRNSLDLAQHVERFGYNRFWVAEHHNMDGIASSATSVLIGYLAGGTSSIRVGSGGVMLPNHAPLVIAEQFGTLASLYPGRIDLGLGRAPSSDQMTAYALRRDRAGGPDDFPDDVEELSRYLGPRTDDQKVIAVPGHDTEVPMWLLGSSLFSAQLAGMRGMPYAFASHFAPRFLHQAIGLYRQLFRPSAVLDKPYVMVGVPVVAAPTDAEAQFLATSTQQRVLGILTGQRGKLPLPVEGFLQQLGPREQAAIQDFLALAVVGGPETVRQGFAQIQQSTEADELILVTDIHDPALRLRSLEISAQALAG